MTETVPADETPAQYCKTRIRKGKTLQPCDQPSVTTGACESHLMAQRQRIDQRRNEKREAADKKQRLLAEQAENQDRLVLAHAQTTLPGYPRYGVDREGAPYVSITMSLAKYDSLWLTHQRP